MADYTHETIHDAIKDIENSKLILPAMQRNFVWPEYKVCDLFDSLLRNYPIGTFLFWMIDKETVQKYAFNHFVSFYDEKNDLQRGDRVTATRDEYIGVLDGQQRLTSIYLALCGYYCKKTKNKTKKQDAVYENFYFCYDLYGTPSDPTDPNKPYPFEFKKSSEISVKTPYYKTDAKGKEILENGERVLLGYHFWIKVSDIYKEDFDASDYLENIESNILNETLDVGIRRNTRKALENLKLAFFQEQNINYFPAKDFSLDKVVEIFVRVNSGGQKLSASDLMLSVATANEGESDIHVKIKNTIEDINGSVTDTENGFKITKEVFLTAALLFVKAENLSLSKKENYEPNRIKEIMSHWDEIKDALQFTTKYIEKIGIIGRTLASSIYLIIAYYFYNHKEAMASEPDSKNNIRNMAFIRQWIVRAIVNEIFAFSTNRIIKNIANEMDKSSEKDFPLKTLMESSNVESLEIGKAQIAKILEFRYGNNCIDPILRGLMKDGTTTSYHIDHIWPSAVLKDAKKFKKAYKDADKTMIDTYKAHCDTLGNLQLLPGVVNQEKSDKLYDVWLQCDWVKSNPDYRNTRCIPELESYKFDNFLIFLEAREKEIESKITACFPKTYDEILKYYEWEG